MERQSGKELPLSSQLVVITDLDGALLDHKTYSYQKALPALHRLKATDTPLVPLSSKTEAEITSLLQEMGFLGTAPFIVENGGAIYTPKGFFGFDLREVTTERLKENGDYDIIELGEPYEVVRKALGDASEETGIRVRSIADMEIEEFAEMTSLSKDQAERAKTRSYQEGFILTVPPEEQEEAKNTMKRAIEEKGFTFSAGGRFLQIAGVNGTKGRAMDVLLPLLKRKYGEIYTLGLGDADSDLPFLEKCDRGVLVANPNKIIEVKSDDIEKVSKIGPEGWNTVVLSFFSSTG